MKGLQASLQAGQELRLAASLSHFAVHDSRKDASVQPAFRTWLSLGGGAKPAASVLLTRTHRPDGVSALAVSAYVGSIVVLPTPFLLCAADRVQSLTHRLQREWRGAGPAQLLRQTRCPPAPASTGDAGNNGNTGNTGNADNATGLHLTLGVRVDHPFFFFLHDPACAQSPALLLSFTVDVALALAPNAALDATLNLLGVRLCRGSPAVLELPAPSDHDLVRPFDLNANVHLCEGFRTVRGTLCCSDVVARLGMKDVRLALDALQNLLPPADVANTVDAERAGDAPSRRPVQKKGGAKRRDGGTEALFGFKVAGYASLKSLKVVVVDDTADGEVPVVVGTLRQVFANAEVRSDAMVVKAECTLDADYYVPRRTVWEPLLEEWTFHATVLREPRERIVGVGVRHEG